MCHADWQEQRGAAPSQMNRTLPGSGGWTEWGDPTVTQIHFKRLALGKLTDRRWRRRESPRYVIMLAECGVPCGPAGGTDHLALSLCVSMCVMERQNGKEREPAVVHLQNHSGLLMVTAEIHNTNAKVTGESEDMKMMNRQFNLSFCQNS